MSEAFVITRPRRRWLSPSCTFLLASKSRQNGGSPLFCRSFRRDTMVLLLSLYAPRVNSRTLSPSLLTCVFTDVRCLTRWLRSRMGMGNSHCAKLSVPGGIAENTEPARSRRKSVKDVLPLELRSVMFTPFTQSSSSTNCTSSPWLLRFVPCLHVTDLNCKRGLKEGGGAMVPSGSRESDVGRA